MKKKVMVLAATIWQIPLIKKLKAMNCEVYNVNLYENSPAFKFADHWAVMDILDKQACFEYAKENKIDAIMSEQCDIATTTIAYVADELGLPGIGNDMAELYTNKFAMREFCAKHGIPSPEYKICRTKQQAIAFFEQVNKKSILKPLDSNSSRGVYTINSVNDIEKYFDLSMGYSHAQKAVLIERYIEGTEFTVDGIVGDNGHISLAISEKHHYEHNPNIADELFFSHSNDKFDYDKLKDTNNRFVNLSKLPFGITHAEYKYEDGKFYLIEIGARGGGNLIGSTIVPLMSGVDNYKYLVNKSLGISIDEDLHIDESLAQRCCVLKFFDTPDNGGKVKAINGIDYLENSDNIVSFKLNFQKGDIIEAAKDDSARIGFYIAYAESKAELLKIMNEIERKFSIELE